jgi:aspartate carbamoyltransferase regulatory subunit
LFPNNKFYLVSPKELSMPKHFLDILKERKIEYLEIDNLQEAVDNSDIVYMTRVQKERLPEDIKIFYDKLKRMFRLKKSMLVNVKANLRILHPLPIPKQVQEIASDVEDTKYCYYFEQAKNGLYVRMAILSLSLGAIPSPDFKVNNIVNERTNFEEVNIVQKRNPDKKIGDIINGVLIDHLPPSSAPEVIRIMGYSDIDNVFLGLNLFSQKYGKKDIIKIESESFDLDDLESLNKLALRCPTATINLIKNHNIVRKGRVKLPSEIYNILVCANGNCISRPEHYETESTLFSVNNRSPLTLECHYCGTIFGIDKIEFKKYEE